jgi:signal transduction histidine kinase/tetratricopeptide (TPR) repeat protein
LFPLLAAQIVAQARVRDSLVRELRYASAHGQHDHHAAMLRLSLALWYMAHNQTDTSAMLGYLRAAHADVQALHDKKITAEYYLAAGNIARRMYRNTEALYLLDTAITLHTELGQRNRVAYALSRIGLVFHQQHLYEIASEYHFAALHQAQMAGDSLIVLTQCLNLADLHLRIEQLHEARRFTQRGVRIANTHHDKSLAASLLGVSAEISLHEKAYEPALKAIDSALAINTRLGHPDDIQYALLIRGAILQAQGDIQAAIDMYKMIADSERVRTDRISDWTVWHLASAAYEQGRKTNNTQLVREAIELAETTLNHPTIEQHNEKLYAVLIAAYQWLGDSSSAFRVQGQSLAFQDSLLRLSMATRVSGMRDYYQLQQRHEEAALVHQERVFVSVTAGVIVCAATLVAWLQWKRSRLKQRTAALLEEKNTELVAINEKLTHTHGELQQAYHDLADSQASLEQQHQALETLLAEQNERKRLLNAAYHELDLAYQEVMANREELEQQNTTLAKLSIEKDELMGIMAHDLKNPLSQIRSMVEFAIEGEFDKETQRSILDSTIRAADRMFHLISTLLEVNRLERGSVEMHHEQVNMASVVSMVIDSFKIAAAEKNITLRVHTPPAAQRTIAFADSTATYRVIENLVSNALKYSPLGSNVFVSIEGGESIAELSSTLAKPTPSSPSSHVVRVFVRDEGPGISQEDKKRLFGKFARLSARPTAKESSTGLGLSIVKKLVEAMNGRVWCESSPESGVLGATFIMELPAAPPDYHVHTSPDSTDTLGSSSERILLTAALKSSSNL